MISPRAVFVAGSLASLMLAAQPARAYRPFDSTDASVAAAGEFELEWGPFGYVRAGPRNLLVVPAVVANLGLFDDWELVLQGRQLIALEPLPGEARGRLVDSGAFLKAVFREGSLQGRSGPSLATEFGALLPTVNGDGGVGATASLLVSQRWDAATLHFNVAASRTRAANPEAFAGLIVEGPYAWRVRPVAEVYYNQELGADIAVSALAGAICRAVEQLSIDVAARASRVGGVEVLELRAGLTWALPVWESGASGAR